MLDYSIKLPKNRRLFSVGFYVMPFFMNVLKLLLHSQVERTIIFADYYYKFIIGDNMKAYNKLPPSFRCAEVKQYYEILRKKSVMLFFKRVLDLLLAVLLLFILFIPIAVISVIVKCTSSGPVFFRQERVTTYGKRFKILKFRTMVQNAESMGAAVTTDNDSRVTKAGRVLRKYRLDELPQIFNVLSGNMTIVGARPEVPQYVEHYEKEYYATLLMPAGITSLASILYKDEEKLLEQSEDTDRVYIEQILPEKMKYNLQYVKDFSCLTDLKLMVRTVLEMIR